MVKYYIQDVWIADPNDLDKRTYISCDEIIEKFGVDPKRCVRSCDQRAGGSGGRCKTRSTDFPNLIRLTYDPSGEYDLKKWRKWCIK